MNDQEALNGAWSIFDGGKGDGGRVACHSFKIVTTRKPHPCIGSREPHDIPSGSRAHREQCVIDGEGWITVYMCFSCIERWVKDNW